MTPFDHLLGKRPQTPREDWLAEKRDEAERLFRPERREWIKGGAVPSPIYGSIDQ